MKKIYVFLILSLFAVSANAQSDLTFYRTVTTPLVPHSDSLLRLMNNTDSFVRNPTTAVEYGFKYYFVNNGPNALLVTDTLFLKSPTFYNRTKLPISLLNTSGIAVHDTVSLGAFLFNFPSTFVASGKYTFCDSIWAQHQNGSVVTDPVMSNNSFCTTNYLKVFTSEVPEVVNNPGTLSIYPNPATSNVNFDYDFTGTAKATLLVTDVVGRTVYQEELNNLSGKKTVSVNVNNFVPGMYMATLIVDDARVVGKFTVQK